MAEESEKKSITLSEGETKLFVSIMKNLQCDIVVGPYLFSCMAGTR